MAANGTVPVLVTSIGIVFRNLATGDSIDVFINFSTPTNIAPGAGGTFGSKDVIFNDLQAMFPSLALLAPICGGGLALQVEAFATDTSGVLHISCDPTVPGGCPFVEVIREPCFSTEIRQFMANTQQFFNCSGVDGEVLVQGTLVHCGSVFGVGVCQDLIGATVHVGLIDTATGIFYEYASTNTQAAGFFGIGFGIKNRTDVVALIPPTGSKAFNIAAVFLGDTANSPSLTVTIPLTVKGAQADACFLGTVLATQTFPTTIPAGEPIHETIIAHTASVVGSLTTAAQGIISTTHDAIVSAGANPIDITVYRGPDVALFSFEGLGLITVPTFTIVSHSWGSPVGVLVIILAIIVALVALGIIIYFILQTARDILKLPGGPAALTTGAIAVAVVAGAALIGGYLLTRRRR